MTKVRIIIYIDDVLKVDQTTYDENQLVALADLEKRQLENNEKEFIRDPGEKEVSDGDLKEAIVDTPKSEETIKDVIKRSRHFQKLLNLKEIPCEGCGVKFMQKREGQRFHASGCSSRKLAKQKWEEKQESGRGFSEYDKVPHEPYDLSQK